MNSWLGRLIMCGGTNRRLRSHLQDSLLFQLQCKPERLFKSCSQYLFISSNKTLSNLLSIQPASIRKLSLCDMTAIESAQVFWEIRLLHTQRLEIRNQPQTKIKSIIVWHKTRLFKLYIVYWKKRMNDGLTGVISSGVVTGVLFSCFSTIALPRSKSQILTGVNLSTDSHNIFSGFKSRWAIPDKVTMNWLSLS